MTTWGFVNLQNWVGDQRCGVRISASQFSHLVIQQSALIYERFFKEFPCLSNENLIFSLTEMPV
jgi:hypothetical protein